MQFEGGIWFRGHVLVVAAISAVDFCILQYVVRSLVSQKEQHG